MLIDPQKVHETIGRYQLADGMPIVADLQRSRGVWLRDAKSGKDYLDTFTCFASWPVGFNHPRMQEPAFLDELTRVASTKLSNADLYTDSMASFVEAFATRVTPADFPYHFWISGGALAVENTLKAAFDWKARKLGRTDYAQSVDDLVVLHFERAFHGRSGYTLSLTNTVPDKTGLFPKFPWPRVPAPALEVDLDGNPVNDIAAAERATCEAIEAVFREHGDKVAAIIIEPMQGEGGDRHFRPELFQALRRYADQHEALLIYDEVQTGFFGSGKPWFWQHHGVAPDLVAFGKKTQVCGVYAGRRLDEVEGHVFRRSSRINSTWGGNLVDMVRCRKFIEIIEDEALARRTSEVGAHLVTGLRALARETGAFTNVRGAGSLVAVSLEDKEARARLLQALFEQQVLALPCGPSSVRFRLPLVMSQGEADELLNRLSAALPAVKV